MLMCWKNYYYSSLHTTQGAMYRFSAAFLKIPMAIFTEIEEIILKFV